LRRECSIDIVITGEYNADMNTTIQIRINDVVKKKAQKAFKKRGLTMSSGLKLYLHDVAENECVHYVPSTPKTRAIRKMMDREVAWAIKHGKRYSSAEEMFNDIESKK